MITFDTETCGLYGPIVLIQYQEQEDIELYNIWKHPVKETLNLIEHFCAKGVIGFNLTFDWFHICQTYTTLLLLNKNKAPNPRDYAEREAEARFGPCVKPIDAVDLFLVARKTKYQSLMDRKDIRIKRVPSVLAYKLCAELHKRVPIPNVYFARKGDPTRHWRVVEDDEDFKDLVLEFAPSSALKALMADINGEGDNIEKYTDIQPANAPFELGYAPFYDAVKDVGNTWLDHIDHYINFWSTNGRARKYAADDVRYTRTLYGHLGRPASDNDSVLACAVAATRWRGYELDLPRLNRLKTKAQNQLKKASRNFNSPTECRDYLAEVMDDTEKLSLKDGTGKNILKSITAWTTEEVCEQCYGAGCDNCIEGSLPTGTHPAAVRAQEILDHRELAKEIELFNKLLRAGHFHPSFKVIGTLSGRMSGADGLNPQGIKKTDKIRSCFRMNCGGDFDAFEVTLMEAAYQDPDLRKDLMSGKKIHALFGELLYGKTYEEILADKRLYTQAKSCVFAMGYGGNEYTLMTRGGVSEERANDGMRQWNNKYKVWGEKRKAYMDMFCSMRQPGGIGTRVEWHEPADYIESLFGFRRYFTLENRICKALFDLAEKPPEDWTRIKLKVVRRDREQYVGGALRSALFAAAFAIQASNMRAAGNHVIQSSGAEITKALQRRIWDQQPSGIHNWVVRPMNVHDEVLAESSIDLTPVVKEVVESYKKTVPLLAIDWKQGICNWSMKMTVSDLMDKLAQCDPDSFVMYEDKEVEFVEEDDDTVILS